MNKNNQNKFGVPGPIANQVAYSNVDYWYGPYDSLEDVYEAIPVGLRKQGLTVGIINPDNGKVVEFQWKTTDVSNSGLTEKVEEYNINIDPVTYTTNTVNNTITFTIKVNGRGFGVLTSIYLNSNKLVSESTLLNLNQNITVVAPENPGNYVYSIYVVDTILNNGAQTECPVVWKEVDIKINSASPIYNFLVKSLLNLLSSSFYFLIFKVDSVDISKVSIIYGNNSKDLYTAGNPYVDTYNVPVSSLEGLESGNLILIKVEGNITGGVFIKDVVQLTAPGVFAAPEGIIPLLVYNGLSFSSTFRFEAENVANYLVVIKDNDEEIVYNSSLLSYSINTITLSVYDNTLSENKTSASHILSIYIEGTKIWEYPTITVIYVPNTEQLSDIDTYTRFKDNFEFNLGELEIVTLQSYILDLNCYVPYTETEETLFEFGGATINRDFIQFRGITYPTPILLDVSIGFMCNVKSSYLNRDYYYDALFINGILCTKSPLDFGSSSGIEISHQSQFTDNVSKKTFSNYTIDGQQKSICDGVRLYYNTLGAITQSPEQFVLERNYKSRNPGVEPASLPIFELTPIQNIKTLADLTSAQREQVIDGKITIDGVEYDVINDSSYRVGTFGNLGDAKYIISEMLNSFCTAYEVVSSVDESKTISDLSKKVKKDVSKIPDNYLTLMKQIVSSKKLLQKYVAVPCEWKYGGQLGYTLVLTQGTSTLEYALPNFTFKFYTDKTFSTKSTVSLVPKISRNLNNLLNYSTEIDENTTYYSEKELVAKVDYMESSHLNNTPTAMFYNALTTLTNGYEIVDSNGDIVSILENPVPGKLNAIEGFPIIVEINGINYGSFMLNIGKDGKSIGFGDEAISLEGTSNASDEGLSSRFDFGIFDTAAYDYFLSIKDNINEVTEANSDFVKFLSGGLEYRYSGHDLDDIGQNEGDENNPSYTEYLRILKMWSWVYTHETYNKAQFEEMFNFDFLALYYIQMMVFGQTDNLGKNCMFDLFEPNGQWYVRPYDMDSQAGLENNGYDRLSPVIEIAQQFALDEATKNIETVTYLGNSNSTRFPYSSKTSNLWIRFYNNLRADIELFYGYLRNLGYSAEAVISLCDKEVISKLGTNLYNKDFQNKYLSNEKTDPYEQFAYGNRWFRFKDWIQKRFDFCDTYFGYNKYLVNPSGNTSSFTIKYSLPQYTIYSYNDASGGQRTTNWGTECTLNFQSITKQNMWFSPKYIVDDDKIFLEGFSSVSPRVKLNNLITYDGDWSNLVNVVDLSENTYLLDMTIANIKMSSEKATIPKSVVTLSIKDSSLIPNLTDFENLKSISFSNCEGNIFLSNCPNLESINIASCKNVNLTLQGCGSSVLYVNLSNSSTTFNLIIFNNSYIKYLDLSHLIFNLSFTGNKSYFKTVNLYYSTILNGELNITNLITDTLILNSISTVKVITSEAKSYRFLGLYGSNVIQWGNTTNVFDGSYFSNLSDIRMIESVTTTALTQLNNNTYTSSISFRLRGCTSLLLVRNLVINADISYLFAECKNLQSITNSSITANGLYMFYRCHKLLTLPTDGSGRSTITLIGNSGQYMFTSCYKLLYSDIEKVLDNNLITLYWNSSTQSYLTTAISGVTPVEACKLTNYTYFLYNKSYLDDTTINLSKYAFGVNMNYCFCITHWGSEEVSEKNTTQKVQITYSGKLPKTLTSFSSGFSSDTYHKCIVDSNVFEDCNKVTNLERCFAYQSYSDDNYFFEVPVLPNNVGLNLDRIFCGSRIDLSNLKDLNDEIYMPSNTISCSSGFGNSNISETLEVSDLFSNCTNLSNLTSCFNTCTNFTCTLSLNLAANNAVVNVAGIFANNPSKVITFGFSGMWYSDPDASNYTWNVSVLSTSNRVGPYNNTKIKINTDVISLAGYINNVWYNMKNVFLGATIDNTESSLNLILSINTKDSSKVCLNLTAIDTAVDSQNKVTITVDIEHSIIENANYAFLNVKLLETEIPIKIPSTLINASYMFAGTNITLLPTGLNNCSRLSNLSYMFYNCRSLDEKIPTNNEYFLPISITNIDHMFDGCYKLYGGIPKNFILTITTTETVHNEDTGEDEEVTVVTRNNLTSLVCTFANTTILRSNVAFSNSDQTYGELNILELFPNVTNVEGLFYYMATTNSALSYSQSLVNTCFSKCTKCDDLFNSAVLSLPSQCDFSAATTLRFAFANGYSGLSNLTEIKLGNKVTDMMGIFSAADTTYRNNNVLNNLEALLAKRKGTYTGMLYGYSNDLSKNEYKYVAPSRTIARSLHG